MANQNATILLRGSRAENGQRALRVVFVDSAGGDVTFTDIGGATVWVADDDYQVADCIGDGTTAPATAVRAQFNINGNDKSKYLNYANIFDPKSSQIARVGAALGGIIPQGTNLRLISR